MATGSARRIPSSTLPVTNASSGTTPKMGSTCSTLPARPFRSPTRRATAIWASNGSSARLENVTFENNLTVHDCNRLSAPFGDAPSSYNQNLSLFCRAAGDCFALSWLPTTTAHFAFNTIVTLAARRRSTSAAPARVRPGASRSRTTSSMDIRAHSTGRAPGSSIRRTASLFTNLGHNIYYGARSCPTDVDPTAKCVDPKLENTPAFSGEASLDAVDMHLRAGSLGHRRCAWPSPASRPTTQARRGRPTRRSARTSRKARAEPPPRLLAGAP